MIDDDLLEDDDDLVGAGIPLLADEDGDVGVLPEEDEDEMDHMKITGPDGEEEEEPS
ncbi:MAG: hypothetical protein JWN49_348 [Parcubacteria group bacterium]|nr:hypothetical protein [Parcubacteria group bacterium]